MKTVKLVSPGNFDIIEEDIPQCNNDNYALIKIASVGICGSDMHYYSNGRIGAQVVEYPFTIGHEASGIIEELNCLNSKFKEGELIVIDPALACNECDQCRADRKHTCRNLIFMGAPGQRDGLMKEYVWVPLENLFSVDKNYLKQEAAFIEPLSIGVYAVGLSKISSNESSAILGAGPIGLSVLMSLLHNGNKNIISTDKLDYRLSVASNLGANITLNANNKNYTENFPGEVDVVFECAGEQSALDFAVDILEPGGRLVIVGIPAQRKVEFDIDMIRRKELTIINVRRQNNCIRQAIDIFRAFKGYSNDILSHNFNPNDTNFAFKLVNNYADGVIKAVINFV